MCKERVTVKRRAAELIPAHFHFRPRPASAGSSRQRERVSRPELPCIPVCCAHGELMGEQ